MQPHQPVVGAVPALVLNGQCAAKCAARDECHRLPAIEPRKAPRSSPACAAHCASANELLPNATRSSQRDATARVRTRARVRAHAGRST